MNFEEFKEALKAALHERLGLDEVLEETEGNASDTVKQNTYPVGDSCILGYGLISK